VSAGGLRDHLMRIVNFETRGVFGIAADEGSGCHGLDTLPELVAHEWPYPA
jgi:hypothetical protein